MKKMLMYLFGNLDTDARVRRTINALKDDFKIDLVCEESDPFAEVTMYFYKKTGSTIKDIISSSKLFVKILNNGDYDCVFGNDFYSLIPLEYIVKHKKKHPKLRVIYDAHELLYDSSIPMFSKHSHSVI